MNWISGIPALLGVLTLAAASSAQPSPAPDYAAQAQEVTRFIQEKLYLPQHGLYAQSLAKRDVEFMWGNGIMFSALTGAARHDPATYGPIMTRFFTAMNRYWDTKAPIPGYEPAPTQGNGNDKYYDDNAWMILAFLEAYDLTGDERFKVRSLETLKFVLSGWDDQLGGGIWWHEKHKDDGKNTCINAPAAVSCLNIAKHQSAEAAKQNIEWARRIVEWTIKHLEAEDGLFEDHIKVTTGEKNRAKLTYNTALMIRAYLGLHRATGEQAWLDKANRASRAADWFTSDKTGAYRDNVKWSHLQVEADLEMYRFTNEPYLLVRATRNADHMYEQFRQNKYDELIEIASVARTLWLLADTQSDSAQAFWKRVDGNP